MKYQLSKEPAFLRQGGRAFEQNRQGGNQQGSGGRPVNGQIISTDDKSFTVKMQDGSSKIGIVSDQTQYNQSQQASKTDLKVGDTVIAIGTTNSDGSVTASNVQLNPVIRNFGQGANPSPGQ
jgi:hypothetical protein